MPRRQRSHSQPPRGSGFRSPFLRDRIRRRHSIYDIGRYGNYHNHRRSPTVVLVSDNNTADEDASDEANKRREKILMLVMFVMLLVLVGVLISFNTIRQKLTTRNNPIVTYSAL